MAPNLYRTILNAYLRVSWNPSTPVMFTSPTDQSLTRHKYPEIRPGRRTMHGYYDRAQHISRTYLEGKAKL